MTPFSLQQWATQNFAWLANEIGFFDAQILAKGLHREGVDFFKPNPDDDDPIDPPWPFGPPRFSLDQQLAERVQMLEKMVFDVTELVSTMDSRPQLDQLSAGNVLREIGDKTKRKAALERRMNRLDLEKEAIKGELNRL